MATDFSEVCIFFLAVAIFPHPLFFLDLEKEVRAVVKENARLPLNQFFSGLVEFFLKEIRVLGQDGEGPQNIMVGKGGLLKKEK